MFLLFNLIFSLFLRIFPGAYLKRSLGVNPQGNFDHAEAVPGHRVGRADRGDHIPNAEGPQGIDGSVRHQEAQQEERAAFSSGSKQESVQ